METEEQAFCIDTDEGEPLVRLSSLITEKSLLDRRKEIRTNLLKIALSDCQINEEFNVQEISKILTNKTKCTLNDEQIVHALIDLEKEDIVKHVHDYSYKLISKPNVLSLEEMSKPVWNEFQVFLRHHYPKYDPYIHSNVKHIFIFTLKKIISRLSASKSINNTESFSFPNIEFDIEHEIKSLHIPDLNARLSEIFVQYLNSNSTELRKFIFNCYYGLVNVDLVAREQEMPELDFGEEIEFLLLDSNFIVPLLCTYDNLHPFSNAVVKQCNKLKISMYYTSRTKNEIWGLIKSSQYFMNGLYGRKIDPSSNQFVTNYSKSNLNWSVYYTFLESWEDFIADNHSILSLPPAMEQNVDEKAFEFVKYALPIADDARYEKRAKKEISYVPHTRSQDNYSHDAYCIALVSYLNDNKISTNKKLGPWFLTYDNLLPHLNTSDYLNKDDFGLVMQAKSFLNYLLVYSKIEFDKEDIEEVAAALITLTTKSQYQDMTLEQYSKIVATKLDLNVRNSKIIKQIFIRSPLLEELKSALSHNENENSADSIAYNILTSPELGKVVDQIISSEEKERQSQQQIDNLKEQLRRATTHTKEEAKIATMENTPTNVNNVSISVHVSNTLSNTVTIESNVPRNLVSLMHLLENEGAFAENTIESPPSHLSLEKASSWIKKVKETIENTVEIKDNLKALLPYIDIVIKSLSNLT